MLHFVKGHFCLLKEVLGKLFATQYDMGVSSDFKTRFWFQQYDISHQQQRSQPDDTRSAELAGTSPQLIFYSVSFL